MSMTMEEMRARNQIMRLLNSQGYNPYAKLLGLFELNLTNDPDVLGFMEPGEGRIVLRRGLEDKAVSVIVRHEILHEFLDHELRLLRKLARDAGLNYNELADKSIEELKQELYGDKVFNVAADYEISNRGYTDADKKTIKNILVNGEIVSGLVTEDEHPEWINWSVEDMYEALKKMTPPDPPDPPEGPKKPPIIIQGKPPKGKRQKRKTKGGQVVIYTEPPDDPDDFDNDDDDDDDIDDIPGLEGDEWDDNAKDNSKPSIGSKGNKELQDLENAEREANKIAGEAEENDNEDLKNDAEDVAKDAADALKDMKDKSKQSAADLKRIQDIKDAFDNVNLRREVMRSTSDALKREQAKAARNGRMFSASPIQKFVLDLNNFIKNEIGVQREDSWSKFNKKYATSNILRPGTATTYINTVPTINVYFDRSGSWNESMLKVGRDAIATLNQYVKKKQIKINIYYFSDTVFTDYDDPRAEGGTNPQPVFDHIAATKPKNVIIMTDGDFDHYPEVQSIQVPGAAWMLFKNRRSQNLMRHLSGKKQTRAYDI